MAYTSADLIEAVKSLASIPSSQNLFSPTDFLRFANRALSLKLTPLLQSAREEYHVVAKDFTITEGKTAYRIPSHAAGAKLRDVKIVKDGVEESLNRLEPEFITTEERGFYLKGNQVVLAWSPKGSEGTLRLSYFRRPGALVQVTSCAVVTSVDTANNQITVASVPSTFAVGIEVDIIEAKPGFDWLVTDSALVGISGSVLTFSSLPDDISEGDYVALSGESPVIQLPLELHPLLEQAVAIQCLDAQNKNSKKMSDDYKEMQQDVLKVLTPRIDGEPKKIVNPTSLLNSSRRWRF